MISERMDASLLRYGRWLRAQGYARNTVKAKVKLVRCVAEHAGVEPWLLTPEDVEDYLDRDLGAWSRRKYLEHLRSYADWAGVSDPTSHLKPPKPPRGIPKPVSEADLAELLEAANARTRAFLVLGAFAGLRSFEIAQVRDDDFEVTSEGWAIRVHGKGDRVDLVPVPPIVVLELREWRSEARGGRLWPGLSPEAVQEAVRRCSKRIGLTTSCHQLRHRYGTMLYRQSRDLLLVQQLMRHESPSTTAGYAAVANDRGAALVALLPLPGGPARKVEPPSAPAS